METKITRVRKRDGTVVLFDQNKITSAIFKAAQSVGGKDRKAAQMLSDRVVKELEGMTITPSIEQIQDTVEKILIEEGHAATAKAYILYRQERAAIRKEKQVVLEKEDVDEVDKRFDVNALRVLKARYLRKDATGKLIETPKQLFTRVAVHAALPDLFYDTRVFDISCQQPVNMAEDFKPAVHEDQYGIGKYKLNRYHLEALKRMYDRFNRNKQMKVTWTKFFDMIKKGDFDEYETNLDEFYNLMTHKLFMPNTPAIANFGNPLGMGSACFHPNQPIMTADGPREIRDVHVGDFVLTHKGRFRRVQKVFVRFANFLLQVNCENLPKPTMLLTEEHPVLNFKNKTLQWVPISKLSEGDRVALSYQKTVVEGIKINENHMGNNTVLLNDTLNEMDVETMKFTNIDEISKVDYVGPVYNLEVEEDHSYVANMVSVHNCFVLDVPDSIDGIMETLKNTAIVFKAGGGMGYNFSKLRPEGDFVSSTGGVASGPLSFMRLFDTMTEVIKQGGIRRGANMGILNSNHPDIEKFITAKEGNKALRNFNISVLIMRDFWKYYENDEPYPLVNPKDGKVVKYVSPRALFDKIVYQAWESAEPGVIFFDRVNDYNPFYEHLGPIVTTNPCVAGDTLISTENGLMPIKELAEKYPNGGIGMCVYQNVQSGNLILKKLAHISEFRAFKSGIKNTIKLRTKKGKELKCTIDHKILTTNGWKEAITLTKQDEIVVDSEEGIDILNSIEPNGIEEVYDITEPSTHSFIANGIVVHNCGEVLLYPNEPCNLGSINVWTFARKDEETGETTVDWEGLKEVTMSCTRFLDNVIDVNNFPLKQIEEMSLATRKIGLGVMGVANLLYELKLPYNTDEGRAFMEKLMEFVAYWSKVESVKLAQLRGNLPYYNKSFYKDGRHPIRGPEEGSPNGFNWNKISQDMKKYGIRNGYTTIIAPTGSISMIAGCSSGMEPVYSVVFEKNVKVGSFFYIDPAAEKVLREGGFFNEKVLEDINRHKGSVQNIDYIPERVRKALVTAMDITPEDHIRALAAFQKWVDSSISKTNNFPANATVEDMRQSYILAYRLGCKDVTVFRDSSIKDQVLVAPSAKEHKEETKAAQPAKKAVNESGGGLMYENGDAHKTDRPMTKYTIKNCPECGTLVELKEGCLHCPGCGWGLCV